MKFICELDEIRKMATKSVQRLLHKAAS